MMKILFPALNLLFEAEPGVNLMHLAQRHSIPLNSYCGGRGTCGKCRVKVKGRVSPPSPLEQRLIPASGVSEERLACQVEVWDDAEVEILQAAGDRLEKALGEGGSAPLRADSGIGKWSLPRPDSLQTPSTSTWEILRKVLRERGAKEPLADWQALQGLGDRIWGWGTWTAITAGSRFLGIEPGDTTDHLYGMAFDIGTTSVVGYLLDLREGKQLALSSMLNPQAAFGADVISRIGLASNDPSNQALLQDRIIQALNALIDRAAQAARIPRQQIYALSMVGNTAMHHLLLALDPAGMGHLPYNPVMADPLEVRASDLGIDAHPQAPIFFLPHISGYVGADIVGGLLFTGLHRREGTALLIDIGTNGEMALGSRRRLLVSSTAAGPAFEGAQVSCGMRAEPGAISQVFLEEGDLRCRVVGEIAPLGLCGSGLVDLVSLLLSLGLIDEAGRFKDPSQLGEVAPSRIRSRLQHSEEGWRFTLAEEGGGLPPVYLAQRDIRELQLAKGAIRAGINILMDELKIDLNQVEEILLAGAFGNYIDPSNAQAIGLLPLCPVERIRPVGNAAGEGAKMALLCRESREEAVHIARSAEFIELASRVDFQDRFVEALAFPSSRAQS